MKSSQPGSRDPFDAPRHTLAETDCRAGTNKPGGRNTPDREVTQDPHRYDAGWRDQTPVAQDRRRAQPDRSQKNETWVSGRQTRRPAASLMGPNRTARAREVASPLNAAPQQTRPCAPTPNPGA
jgi:hypothetical protein